MRRIYWLLACTWPAISLTSSVAALLFARVDGAPPNPNAWYWQLAAWGFWWGFTPVVGALANRFSLLPGRRRADLLIHVAALLLLTSLHVGAVATIRGSIEGVPLAEAISSRVPTFLKYDTLLYGLVLTAVLMLKNRRRARLSELQRARAMRGMAAERLDRLVEPLDLPGVLGTLAVADQRLRDQPLEAEETLLALSRRLRERLGERTSAVSGAHSSEEAEKPSASTRVPFILFPAYGVYVTLLFVARDLITERRIEPATAAHMLAYLAVSAFLPFFLDASRRFVVAGREWRRNLTVQILLCLLQAVIAETIVVLLRAAQVGRPPGESFGPVLLLSAFAVYVIHADAFAGRDFQERQRIREVKARAAEARLRTLRSQIEPHFLFNTINSILTLIRRDASQASQMIDRLRNILVSTLSWRGLNEVPLREDLELTVSYLEIERIRFRDALDIEVDIDASVLDCPVPAFLLQPLVENAVRHGSLAAIGRGVIAVRAKACDSGLEICVENDCELIDIPSWRMGIGLTNVSSRLEQLHGEQHEFAIEGLPRGGVRVRIQVPMRVAVG